MEHGNGRRSWLWRGEGASNCCAGPARELCRRILMKKLLPSTPCCPASFHHRHFFRRRSCNPRSILPPFSPFLFFHQTINRRASNSTDFKRPISRLEPRDPCFCFDLVFEILYRIPIIDEIEFGTIRVFIIVRFLRIFWNESSIQFQSHSYLLRLLWVVGSSYGRWRSVDK